MPPSRQKEERIWKLAYKMARSGEYSGWLPIEWGLQSMGYSRVHQLLDDEAIREQLDRMCAKAQKGRTGA